MGGGHSINCKLLKHCLGVIRPITGEADPTRTFVLSHPDLSRMEMLTELSVSNSGRLLPKQSTRGFSGSHIHYSRGFSMCKTRHPTL